MEPVISLRPRSLVLLTAACLLAACGGTPTAPPSGSRLARSQGLQDQRPIAQPTETPPDPALRATVDAAVARLDAVRTIAGKLAFREFKGSAEDRGDAAIAFRRKPFAARVDIVESDRLLAHGGSLLWTGGTKLRIKPLKMPFSLEFAWDNAQVVSVRGYRIDQTDIFSMGKVLRHPAARLRALGEKRLRGEAFYCIEAFSPASLPGITREIIGIHAVHGIPTYREMYEGERLVHQGQGYQLRVDKAIDDDRFEI